MEERIEVSISDLITAFYEWNKDVEDHPERFKKSANVDNAQLQAETLIEYINDIQSRE